MTAPEEKNMDELVALCKRRGFVYPASEIYGGLRGFWDYGPLGTALKNNIRDWWWRCMVDCPPIGPDGEPVSIVGLDSAIIQNPKTWEHSGHVGGFNDPMMDDTETKQRFRADHLIGLHIHGKERRVSVLREGELAPDTLRGDQQGLPNFTIVASSEGEALAVIQSDKSIRKRLGLKSVSKADSEGVYKGEFSDGEYDFSLLQVTVSAQEDYFKELPSPFTNKLGTLTEPRQFNLMLDTYPGPIRDEDNKAYLRPETAQGIFLNFKNVMDTMRVKVPFGIAQIGKSFRNEVTPRNFIFRSREFEQMEMEFFCPPEDSQKWYEFWRDERFKWWLSLGVSEENLILRDHGDDELA
ncbi:MAG: glycine--tRNA ligase, partial [Planctomycetota bacterium]